MKLFGGGGAHSTRGTHPKTEAGDSAGLSKKQKIIIVVAGVVAVITVKVTKAEAAAEIALEGVATTEGAAATARAKDVAATEKATMRTAAATLKNRADVAGPGFPFCHPSWVL